MAALWCLRNQRVNIVLIALVEFKIMFHDFVILKLSPMIGDWLKLVFLLLGRFRA